MLIIIIFSPLSFYIFNFNFYNNLYEKNGVYEVLDKNDVAVITASVFNFFKHGQQFKKFNLKGNINYFNENEISHLNDVRILLGKIFIIFYSSIVMAVILTFLLIDKNHFKFLRNISIVFLISSSILIIFLAVLYFLASNFGSLFDKFHLSFFPQGNWAFTEGSLIITIFPFGFFYDFFFKLLTSSFIISIILIVFGITGIVIANKRLAGEKK